MELDTHGHSGTPDANVRIYQDLATCPGATYAVSYSWRPRPSVSSAQKLEVRWAGGSPIATHGPFTSTPSTTSWTQESSSQTASSVTTRVEFAETGTGDQLGMLLDTVSVQGPDSSRVNGCSSINIKPHSDPNSINLGSGGVVPVIIWGSADFDVSMIDPYQLSFMTAEVKTVGKSDRALCSIVERGSPNDTQFDGMGTDDGYLDLTCHFLTQEISTLGDGSTEATVTAVICPDGYNLGCSPGSPTITFSDAVNIVKE